MCSRAYHDELKGNWERFEQHTEAGFLQSCAGFVFEARLCRRCRSSLAHPRDLARYGLLPADAR